MKTPDEIKKELERCTTYICGFPCEGCLYGIDAEKVESDCVDALLKDALAYIQQLENHIGELAENLELAKQENAGLSIMLTSAQSTAETWKRMTEAIQSDFGEFAARINTGEDMMGCEYCKKNYAEGECNCNCLKDFEWIGVKEDENE